MIYQRELLTPMSLAIVLLLSACGGGANPLDAAAKALSTGELATLNTPSAPTATAPSGATDAGNWVQCAREGGTCSFTGRRDVRYVAIDGSRVLTQVAQGSVACVDSSFQAAVTNYENLCSYASTTTTAPVTAAPPPTAAAPSPAPAPTPSPAPSTGNAGPRVSAFAASGPITATSGQVIAGVRISNSNGPCIVIPRGVTGVVVRDSDIGPCEGEGNIVVHGNGATIEYNFVHDGARGVLVDGASNVTTRMSKFNQFHGPKFKGTAIEYDGTNFGVIDGNVVTGKDYASDAVSGYESSNMRMTNNSIDITVAEPSAAAFTMGDSTTGKPGANNYVAGNTVRQGGGVPAGVFGSNGNTVLEKNCLTAGIQAYNFSGIFVGVTVRNNVINMGASFVPDKGVVAGWTTNINSTNCALVPN